MPQTIHTGIKQLVAEAEKEIETLSADEARALHGDDSCVFVDLRDIRELKREGTIPGAVHVPRGMLEFWIDPDSPYHKDIFNQDVRYIFFCASGWRSALATQSAMRMGLKPAAHIGGGFKAWVENRYPVEPK
ncbi:rhodanese-like domain-containing protein [Coralliovum pocilloporae]|uniref:rhodanese-like domain-containing protein n=1 Tax=Coralliovum pocilloporae TaxID=3066369 RepID=UPI003307359B